MLNVTQIPALRVPFIDPNTGLISREWYRFLLNLFTLTGSGNNQISLDDVQVGPPSFPALEFALSSVGLNSDVAPPPTPPQDIPDYFSIAPPVIPNSATGVTSVSATVPSFLSVSGVPITSSGTIAISYSGTALPTAYGGTGSTSSVFVDLGSNVAGVLPTGNGGTGASSLAGAGIVTLTDGQVISGQKSFTSYTNQFRGITYATSDGGSGSNAYLGEDSAYAVVGGASGVVLAYGGSYPGTPAYVGDSVSFRPYADAAYSLGTGPQRWTAVYAVNGTIQTSDGNEKQQIEELSAAELAVAKRIKGLIRKFKFNDSVAEKGDGARIHVGVIAQDVHDAFVAEGLDPYKYGLFCSDTWTTLDGTSKTRLGVRYEELLAFVIAAL